MTESRGEPELNGDSNVYAHALNVRRGDGSPTFLNPALAVYVWSSRGIAQATRDSINELQAIGSNTAALHGGSADLLANLPNAMLMLDRSALPNWSCSRRWVGLGIDGSIAAWRAGRLTSAQIIARYAAVATLCDTLGVEALVLNGESGWALAPGNVRSSAEVKTLAGQLGAAICAAAPSVIIGLSSFGRLGSHADVRALIEGLTPHCSLFTGQSYAARPGPVAAGVLPTILALDERSQNATVRQGWMRADDTDGEDSHDDLDRVPSIQGHKTAPQDLCKAAAEHPLVLLWSVPMIAEGGRTDAEGLEALRAARVIRCVECGPGAVAAYQRAYQLRADGVPGPKTTAHARANTDY